MKEIREALERIDSESTAERLALMNTICARIIEREDQAITAKDEYIFAMHGFAWNNPESTPDRIISQHYDRMLTKHPMYGPGTPTARIKYLSDNTNYPTGNADPVLVGRLQQPIYSIELRTDDSAVPYYLGKYCLSLVDVITPLLNTDKNLSKYLPDDVNSLSLEDDVINIPELRICLSSTKREVSLIQSGAIEDISDVAYGWNEILQYSDLSGLKGARLLGHIATMMHDWQN